MDRDKLDNVDQKTLDEAYDAVDKVRAAIYSNNNPAVIASYIQPPSTITMVMISIGLLVVAIVGAQISNYREIRRNWSHYRCEPSIAPFA